MALYDAPNMSECYFYSMRSYFKFARASDAQEAPNGDMLISTNNIIDGWTLGEHEDDRMLRVYLPNGDNVGIIEKKEPDIIKLKCTGTTPEKLPDGTRIVKGGNAKCRIHDDSKNDGVFWKKKQGKVGVWNRDIHE